MFPVSRLRSRSRSKIYGPIWTPARITTALWLDASDASTITLNGSNVTQWNDKSGNGRNAAQSTAANQPTFANSQVTFDGSNDYFTLASNVANADATNSFVVFFVGAADLTGRNNSTGAAILTRQLVSDGAGSWHVGVAASGNMVSRLHITAGNNLTGLLKTNTGTISTNTGFIGEWEYTGTAGSTAADRWVIRKDGGSALAESVGTTEANWNNPAGATYIGTGWLTDAGYQYKGTIQEIVLVPNSMSASDRQIMEGYLAWKWGGF
jgi:hypothetical protein